MGDSLKIALPNGVVYVLASWGYCPEWLSRFSPVDCFAVSTALYLTICPVAAVISLIFLPRDVVRERRWLQGIVTLIVSGLLLYRATHTRLV